jgi:aminocarboxymuconate-semialdehyde decarboxylase
LHADRERSDAMTTAAIDVHAHHVPDAFLRRVLERASRAAFPHCLAEDVAGGVRLKIGEEPWTRPVAPGLRRLDSRRDDLRTKAIVAQLNGGWTDFFGYSLPAGEGAAWSAFVNDTLLESLTAASSNELAYGALATVPLQDGVLAAAELTRAIGTGHHGAMISTWIPLAGGGGRDLDDPGLEPFWAEAARLDVPVFVHPVFAGGGGDSRIADLGLANAVARPGETALAMTRLLYAGVLDRHPALKLVIAHGGGALPPILGRIMRNYDLLRAAGENVADPAAGFAKLYFDSIVFSPHALRALLAIVRPEAIMLGSDDPFPIGDPQPRRVIETPELGLDAAQQHALLAGNALAAFGGLRGCCGHHFA